jgi:hypothetical protein
MIESLKQKLNDLGAKKFQFLGPLTSFITDITLVIYVNKVIVPRVIQEKTIIQALILQGYKVQDITADSMKMIQDLVSSSVSIMFWAILVYNFIIYALAMKNINWSKKYIKGYAFSAVILSAFEVVGVFITSKQINYVTLITMITYFFVYFGYRHFMQKKEL